MTIDDELLLELIKPEKDGRVGKDSLIVKIVGTHNIDYVLEEPTSEIREEDVQSEADLEYMNTHEITPDITVVLKGKRKEIAFELENDVQWDFGESLRQVKRYQDRFSDTRVIIPEEYRRFAPLYANEGFRVYLWKATRIWQCLKCGTETEKEGPFEPQCKKCNKTTKHRLVRLKDADIEEYT